MERAAGAAAPLAPGACGRRRAGQAGAGDPPAFGAAAPAGGRRGGVFSQLPPGGYGGLELCGQHGLPLFRLRRMEHSPGLSHGPRRPQAGLVRYGDRTRGENDRNEGAAFGVHSGGPGFSRAGCRSAGPAGDRLCLDPGSPGGRKDHPAAGPDPPNLRWQRGGSGRCGPAGGAVSGLVPGLPIPDRQPYRCADGSQ